MRFNMKLTLIKADQRNALTILAGSGIQNQSGNLEQTEWSLVCEVMIREDWYGANGECAKSLLAKGLNFNLVTPQCLD